MLLGGPEYLGEDADPEDLVGLKMHGLRNGQNNKCHGERVAAVVKELAEGRGRLGAPCLLSISCIHRLIEENVEGGLEENPSGHIHRERKVVEQNDDVG